MNVTAIHRYPMKGLSAEALESVEVSPGEGLPHDRRFAIAHGEIGFDRDNPELLPKTHFLMLMRNEKLAALETRFDPAAETLTVIRQGRQVSRGCLTQALGRSILEEFFEAYMKSDLHGELKIVDAPGHQFSDHSKKVLSLINLASVRDLERVVGKSIDPVRFRGNILFDSDEPWVEFTWLERGLRIGEARMTVTKCIDRCAATSVNPQTAERDMNLVKALQRGFGHIDMGVYARVETASRIAVGDPLIID